MEQLKRSMHRKEIIHPSVSGEEDQGDSVLAERTGKPKVPIYRLRMYKIYVQGMHKGRPSCTQGAHGPVVHPKMLSTGWSPQGVSAQSQSSFSAQ